MEKEIEETVQVQKEENVHSEEVVEKQEESLQTDEKKEKKSKIACIKENIQNEIEEYQKDEESSLEKYAKFSLANIHIFAGLVGLSLVILYLPLNFKFASQIIGVFTLLFAVATILITKYYLDNKDNEEIKLHIYDCWQKSILTVILVNFGLYAFSTNPHEEMLVILSFAAVATIFIQNGVKRSLSLL